MFSNILIKVMHSMLLEFLPFPVCNHTQLFIVNAVFMRPPHHSSPCVSLSLSPTLAQFLSNI